MKFPFALQSKIKKTYIFKFTSKTTVRSRHHLTHCIFVCNVSVQILYPHSFCQLPGNNIISSFFRVRICVIDTSNVMMENNNSYNIFEIKRTDLESNGLPTSLITSSLHYRPLHKFSYLLQILSQGNDVNELKITFYRKKKNTF